MADALDLGSSDFGRKGSSPLSRTKRVRLTLNQNKPVSTAHLTKVADWKCEYWNFPVYAVIIPDVY